MSFPRYPKYKPSAVEWLGDVPEGWTVRPLKTIASGTGALFIDGDWIESKDISSAGIRYLTSGNVGEGFYKEQGQGFITEETFRELKCTEVLPGDLLISRLNVPIGRACIVPDLGSKIVTCVDNVVVRPASIFSRQFCVFLLSCKGHLENTEILGRGATMPRLSRSALGRLPFAFPPLAEQTAIAEFLDRETGKIDELVAEQRRLMELLKEKRQAVISHAVTKGLNPHAPMKPSGIEWLGDVPVGWEVRRLSFTAEILAGHSFDASLFGSEGTPVIRMSDFGDGSVRLDDVKRVEPSNVPEKSLAQKGDILLGLSGSISNFAEVREQDLPIAINQRVAIVRMNETHRHLVTWFLQSSEFLNQITADLPETTIQNVSMGQLRRCRIPMPPPAGQVAIVEYLATETAKLNTLTAEAQRAIDLLQERRTALISAAVTGQIDVRQHPKN